jgi:hypothetical protein
MKKAPAQLATVATFLESRAARPEVVHSGGKGHQPQPSSSYCAGLAYFSLITLDSENMDVVTDH